MAIIYSYPETIELLPTDMLIGTSTIKVAGKRKNITKNFTLDLLKTFILNGQTGVQWGDITGDINNQTDLQNVLSGKQNNITLTTIGTSGPATLSGATLNIPNYAGVTYTFTSPLVNTAGVVTINQSSATTDGYLSSADWGIFNSKQNALSGTGFVKISGTTISYDNTTYYPYPTGTTSQYVRGDGSLATFPTTSVPTLNQVLTAGNVSLLDAKIGVLYGYDNNNADYGTLEFYDSGVVMKAASTNKILFYNDGLGSVSFSNGGYNPILNFAGVGDNLYTFQNANGTLAFLSDIPSLAGYVPTSRTLTINGITYDLTANRSWTISTSTSPLTTKGDLYTFSTVDARLPIGLDTQVLLADSSTPTGLKWGTNTAATPLGYYLSISDSTDQTNPTANTPRAVKFNTIDLANGFSLQTETAVFTGTINNGGAGAGTILNVTGVASGTLKVGMVLTGGSITAGTFISAFTSGTGGIGTYEVSVSQNRASATYTGTMTSEIVCANTGVYNIQFSSQMDKSDAGVDYVNFWLRKNGVDLPESTGVISLQGNAPAYMMAAWNYLVQLVAGDVIELYWGSADVNMEIIHEPAQTSPFAHPAIQSTILTITQQSGIMAGTGITAINGLTGAAQTLTVGTTGTDFAIVDSGVDHKFNLPTASATNRGALSSSDWSAFNGKFTLPSLTSGSVLFSNGTTIAQDNVNFFWDDANNRLGIGTSAPANRLHVKDGAALQIVLEGTAGSPEGILSATGGFLAVCQPLTNNYIYGPLTMNPAFGSITYLGQDVLYGSLTSGYIPKKSPIGVTDSNIYDDGTNLGIGTIIPATKLDVNGVITATGGNSTSWNAKQDAITLTTTGTSGPATLVGATLNIPQYGGGGGSTPVKLTSQTLAVGSWTLISGYYTYAFSDVNVTTTCDVSVTPQNASYLTAYNAQVLPFVGVAAGVATFYSQFPPQADIVADIVITQTT